MGNSSIGIEYFLDTSAFPPRWQCGEWEKPLGWLHITSDLAIWGAYMAIPLLVIYYFRKSSTIQFSKLYWLFAVFILACGTTHLIEAIIFYHPIYRIAGVVKAVTAIVSWATVVALLPAVPQALRMKTVEDLEREVDHHTRKLQETNKRLQLEIERRKQADQRLYTMVEAAPMAIVMIDVAGVMQLVNLETVKLFGYARDELLGKTVECLVPVRFRGDHPANRTRFFQHPETRRMGLGRELYGLKKDGSEFPIEIGLNPYNTDEGMFVISTIVDISQRKALQENLYDLNESLLANNQSLVQTNSELAHFAHLASHDLQEPLRTLTSYSQLLQQRHGDKLDDEAEQFLSFMGDASQRMAMLINGLLNYSRIGHAGERTWIDCDAMLADMQVELAYRINSSRAILSVKPLPRVYGFDIEWRQLFQNLISNALKFHRDGVNPDVRVWAEAVEDQRWAFYVKDNGIGIEERHFEKIFSIFQRLHSPKVYEGTGVGLANCKKIVEHHGGDITLTSVLGEGTTFIITLPSEYIESSHANA